MKASDKHKLVLELITEINKALADNDIENAFRQVISICDGWADDAVEILSEERQTSES